MRALARILFGAAAVPAVAALLLAAPLSRQSGLAGGSVSEAEAAAPPVSPGGVESRAVRAVSPERFASPLAAGLTALERVEPREPFAPAEKKKERVAVVLLPRPQSPAAGRFRVGHQQLRLRHVIPTETGLECPNGAGGTWPCGMLALTHQRMLLRNRSITCEGETPSWQGVLVTACRIGGVDIAEWLVRNGWARAESASPLEGLMDRAEADRLGLFGGDPRNVQP